MGLGPSRPEPSCPKALSSKTPTLVLSRHLECGKYRVVDKIICARKLYNCGGVFVYLPPYSATDLNDLYTHYGGQAKLTYNSSRPVQQSDFVSLHVPRMPNMTIREFGCAQGILLSKLCEFYHPLHCVCNEVARYDKRDPAITQTSSMLLSSVGRASVDLFLSSHVVEHVAPDEWFPQLGRAVKPGGFVFTEFPDQWVDIPRRIVRGKYHVAFYNNPTFDAVMHRAGFDRVAVDYNRSRWIHQKRVVVVA